jgi:hypothetical protein
MNDLIQGRMANQPDWEHGDLIRANGTPQQKTGGPNSARYRLEVIDDVKTQYTHSFHSHPYSDAFIALAGDADLWALWNVHYKGHMHDPSTFVYGVIGAYSSMILKIENLTKFHNFFYGILSRNNYNETLAREEFERTYNDEIRPVQSGF